MGSPSWARQAMIATSSPLAVEAALWALAEGGTAMDAALASDAVLGVVQPMSTGVGGDLFCLVDDGREVVGFNGSGPAPRQLTLDACRREGIWHDGSPLCVTVPGVVDGWAQLGERYGRLGLSQTTRPARRLAADGFPLAPAASATWRAEEKRIPGETPLPRQPSAGERMRNADLAATLGDIAAGGPAAHYEGAWAKAAVAASEAVGGVLELEDLASHRGEWVQPISTDYRGHTVVELPPNGQGAAVLAALNELDGEPLGRARAPGTVAHTMVAVRHGMEAAYEHVADPRGGAVAPFWEGRDTVYTAVVADGMCVSLISSVFFAFGSGIWAGGTFLQNRGYGFSLDPGHPNAVAGGKRPFHTIIPGLVRSRGRTETVLGVVGGPMQPQGQVQVLTHLIDHGLDAQAALDEPRAFWLGGNLVAMEPGFDDGATDALGAAGFDVVAGPVGAHWFGVGQVIRSHGDGWLEGGSDPRHDGVAVGMIEPPSRDRTNET
ncbi:MAG: gamma-glutamyltransferase [Acidimicrobiia bacterium]|nr:gamma-glutamyltransferase [Acidimicrobiia bacterium]